MRETWSSGVLAALLATLASGATVTFDSSATRFNCPNGARSPVLLESLSDDKGEGLATKLIVPPTSADGRLCTLTRVDDEFNPFYIPIARAFDADGDWAKSAARYVDFTSVLCGQSELDGPPDVRGVNQYSQGEHLCQITITRPLAQTHVGYYLTTFVDANLPGVVANRRAAARFLERTTWGPTWEEITTLEAQIDAEGNKALANWVADQVQLPPTSHRAFFRRRLNPRSVESYQYGITTGPCDANARFRRFAFTYKDVELSRGSGGGIAGSTGHPYTPMKIETVGGNTIVKFGDDIRTVLDQPLQYVEDGANVTLTDGSYTLCMAEEVVGRQIGENMYNYQFQILIGDLCTSSYTNRGGSDDGKGDGSPSSEVRKVNGSLVRSYDSAACNAKCGDNSKVKMIITGNPEIKLPESYDITTLSWLDMSDLSSELVNLNSDRTHDSVWLRTTALDVCDDENGDAIPDPAGLANIDYFSTGRGKYNLDRTVFAKLPGTNKWAIHDPRALFNGNTLDEPLMDGGGGYVKRASRDGDSIPATGLVVRCSSAERTVFNEESCKISYAPDACTSLPMAAPDGKNNWRSFSIDPGGISDTATEFEVSWKYLPDYAGPAGPGVVVCGVENEVAPDPTLDDHFDIKNRKVESHRISYYTQKSDVWLEISMTAPDQLCQRVAWQLYKIFATSNNSNSATQLSEANLQVFDNHVNGCYGTYKDMIKRVSFNEEMAAQLTFLNNQAVATAWHRSENRKKKAWPDENYARENLQLHSIGIIKLHDDGTPILDQFGKRQANYQQKHIFTAAKVWTGLVTSRRRGNYEDLDWATTSYLDPLRITSPIQRDWFPKIDLADGYIGDRVPLCADLPPQPFLKKNARFRLLGGSTDALSSYPSRKSGPDDEFRRYSLEGGSALYTELCNPKSGVTEPTTTLTAGTATATHDSALGAPTCLGRASKCDSGTTLEGRRVEANSPNTLDDCLDGDDTAVYDDDESVKKIVVETISGNDLRGGEQVTLKATAFVLSKSDRVDYYYAADATNPDWKHLTSMAPPQGESVLEFEYERRPEVVYRLPQCLSPDGCKQAVRVVLRSSRDPANPVSGRKDPGGYYLDPNEPCPTNTPYHDIDDLSFDVLPSYRPKDLCDFQTTVTLTSNLACTGLECFFDTLGVFEVEAGVHYEYIEPKCVHMPFYDDAAKVMAEWSNDIVMCADKRTPSAMATCVSESGYQSDRHPSSTQWADVLSNFREEKLTYAQNEQRCSDWTGRAVGDPQRIGPYSGRTGHCNYYKNCMDVRGTRHNMVESHYHWTADSCEIQVKVDKDGMIAIVHQPANTRNWKRWSSSDPPFVQSHVDIDETVSYFFVQWESTSEVGRLNFPNVEENACDGGTADATYCVCTTSVSETAVFTGPELPSRQQIMSALKVGAFDPAIFDDDTFTLLAGSTEEVAVYKNATDPADYTVNTIIRIKDMFGQDIFLKNVLSTVSVCNGSFSFRNAPSFFSLTNPSISAAYHELDEYMEMVDNHPSAPPFVCQSLLKLFGFSNADPMSVSACSKAYQEGKFTWTNPDDDQDTVQIGDGTQRGNLAAIAGSILLSKDALSPTVEQDPMSGGLKSPVLKLLEVLRGFKLTRSLHHRRTDGLLMNSRVQEYFGESIYGTPDQFSFYDPFYQPAGEHKAAFIIAPEAELLNLGEVINAQNALYSVLSGQLHWCYNGVGASWARGVSNSCGSLDGSNKNSPAYLDYSPVGNETDAANVVGQLATILTSDRLSLKNRALIEAAFDASKAEDGAVEAMRVAQKLIVTSPEFHSLGKVDLKNQTRDATARPISDGTVPEYKAIIHLSLFGGLDSMNMLVPHPDGCSSLYEEYYAIRGEGLRLEESEMTKINATSSNQPCSHFGLHANLPGLVQLYNDSEVLFFANSGHLQKNVNRKNFQAETQAQLFGHHTMTSESFYVDAFRAREETGVLGRMVDVLGNSMSTGQTSIARLYATLNGNPTLGRKVDIVPTGGTSDFFPENRGLSSKSQGPEVEHIMRSLNPQADDLSNIHSNLWSQAFINSESETSNYRSMLATVQGSGLIPNTSLGRKLNMIYRLILLRVERSVDRDVFACQLGGFDHHFSLKSALPGKFSEIDGALKGFRDALSAEEGLWNQVTLVMTSEFGRSITQNSSGGTDHGWGQNQLVMGGAINGGRILGKHPDNYSLQDQHVTGRGAWIPTTSNDAFWVGIAQWFGITSDMGLNYVLPNLENFGCSLFSEADMYRGGTATMSGCGGESVQMKQRFFITEPRLLNPDEQKSFCKKIVDAMGDITTRCVVLDQILASAPARRRLGNRILETVATLDVVTEVSSDQTDIGAVVEEVTNDPEFQDSAAESVEMEVVVEGSVQITSSPTSSPTSAPSSSPTRPEICSLFTSTMFDNIAASSPNALYTHAGFCDAVDTWNSANPDAQVFMDGTEMQRKQELASFFGNTAHETGDFLHAREEEVCNTAVVDGGTTYCQPTGYNSGDGDFTSGYCSLTHTPTSDPDGCSCTETVSENISNGYTSNSMFYGRGPLQLSWNYNYNDAGAALGVDLCTSPDLVATNSSVAWQSAFHFWMASTGSTGTTCHDYVLSGDFGGTVKTINGGLECPVGAYQSGFDLSVISRLNKYCKAGYELSVDVLLDFDACSGLQTSFDSCVSESCSGNGCCSECNIWVGRTLGPTGCKASCLRNSSANSSNFTSFLFDQAPSKSPSSKPSDAPSSSPTSPTGSPTVTPTTSPTISRSIEAYYGYEYVGPGQCIGYHPFLSPKYDYMEFESASYETQYACPGVCYLYLDSDKFRGFEFSPTKCRCLFDEGADFSSIQSTFGGSPASTDTSNLAQGDIVDVVDQANVFCYRSEEPVAPVEVVPFEYVGVGNCLNATGSSGRYYDYVEAGIKTFAECGSTCENFEAQKGFYIVEDTSCNCLFESGITIADQTVVVPPSISGGVGDISSSDFTGDGHCYLGIPPPTISPTTASPSMSPSMSPTTASPTTAGPSVSPTSSPATASPSKSPMALASPSASPTTVKPTTAPSNGPSPSPTTAIPSTSPTTVKPTTAPSTGPSPSPTTPSPSTSPTTVKPTTAPSTGPSLSPTTPSPSMSPTTPSPSTSPTTASPTTMQPTPPEATTKLIFTGEFICRGVNYDYPPVEEDILPVLQQAQVSLQTVLTITACSSDPLIQSCQATVVKINGEDVSSNNVRRRRLQSSTLLVEFKIVIQAVCSTMCENGSSVQQIANQVYSSVTGDLRNAIDSGNFVTALSATSAEVASLLATATASGNFDPVVIPLLSLISDWFPNWSGGSTTCLNDLDRAPTYMKLNRSYLEKSLDACCARYFSWAYDECSGQAAASIDGWFPNWGGIAGSGSKCLNDGNPPGYMRANVGQWLYSGFVACCQRYYGWDYNHCLVASSGGPITTTGSLEWYVHGEVCRQDCAEGSSSTCGGFAEPWNELFSSASACCENRLPWITNTVCEARSTNSAVTGSNLWFVDWTINKCVRDCDDASDQDCGGIANSWDHLHPSSSVCCQQLWYIERAECTRS